TLFDFHASIEETAFEAEESSAVSGASLLDEQTQNVLTALMQISVDELSPLQVSRAVQELQKKLGSGNACSTSTTTAVVERGVVRAISKFSN
ncbi:MAG: hypothetical protein K2X47_11455, partial [Bdellovibrionales bacterium]|nr:hypothetical protein [Bdellovibrionales bacterium]